jgi:hypothetical protein
MKTRSDYPEKDPFLSTLVQKSTPEKTSPDFTQRVMDRIEHVEESTPETKTIGSIVKSVLPWVLFVLIGLGMIYLTFWMNETNTSDTVGYMDSLMVYVGDSFRQFFDLFSSKFMIIGLMIFACGILFFILDRVLSKSKKVENQYLF